MNGTDLFNKASKAAYDYKSVYGKFPSKIGIHTHQLGLLPLTIRFPLLPQINVFDEAAMEDIGSHIIEIHETTFEPVIGSDIHMDEVYLPIPGDIDKCVSGTFVARMAKEFE
jgi:hypothetical protein